MVFGVEDPALQVIYVIDLLSDLFNHSFMKSVGSYVTVTLNTYSDTELFKKKISS